MRAKVEARAETKRQERQADTAKVDTTAPMLAILSEAFLSAADNLKWPKLRLKTSAGERVVLSRCGENSKTPGHINITDGGRYGENRYYGRISHRWPRLPSTRDARRRR